ncbi:seminase-like [Drosophila serrata]|uniref:seminase-like n=1 Tax=Drosophila serrata TaxID=7274 RepID=UPI000A1D1F8F|nr:seminase-like [Drosophila serrata]
MAMLSFQLSGYFLAVVALARIDYVLAEDVKIDVDKLRKLVTTSPLHTRVVGGSVTTNGKLGGYLVQLHYMDDFICGGSLIHDLIVLTAAHCFIGRPHIQEWMAVGGASTLHETGERRRIKEMIKPLSFNATSMNMDVALLMLKKPMKGTNIGKLSLCKQPLKNGNLLTVSGWGMTDSEQTGPQELLRTVQVPVIDKRVCRSVYRSAVELSDTMFCAGVLGKQDACVFDSGGPIVRNKEVCGIVSFGIGCAGNRYPGVYTDITYLKPFIEKSMKALLKE